MTHDSSQPKPRAKNSPLPLELKSKAKALFIAGEKVANIAREIGVSDQNIHSWSQRGGWHALKQQLVDKTAQRIVKAQATVKESLIVAHQDRITRLAGKKLDTLEQFQARKASDHLEIARSIKVLDDVARRNLGLEDSGSSAPRQTINLSLGTFDPKPVFDVQAAEDQSQVKDQA